MYFKCFSFFRFQEGFVTTMGGPKEIQERVTNGIVNLTLGLGTIAAVLYIQGR